MKKYIKPALFIIIALYILIAGVLVIKKQNEIAAKNSVKVYFVKTERNKNIKLVSVRRTINFEKSIVKQSLGFLFDGPFEYEKNRGYFSEIPQNAKIIEVSENSDKVIIDVSKEFEEGGGSESMNTRLLQLSYTATSVIKDKPVYLEIEGKQVTTIGGEGVEVPRPLLKAE